MVQNSERFDNSGINIRQGLSVAAQEQLGNLLRTAEHESITHNVLSFLRETGHDAPALPTLLVNIARDPTHTPSLRLDAMVRLGTTQEGSDTLLTLATDQEPNVSRGAFRELVKLHTGPP